MREFSTKEVPKEVIENIIKVAGTHMTRLLYVMYVCLTLEPVQCGHL